MRAFRIAYDGSPFHGFQRQPDVSTVADALLSALRELDVPFEGDTPPGYAAAGRTDAGVSALAQTVAFEAPEWLSPAAFNSALPADIRAWAHADTPNDFHATHDAVERGYTYSLYAPAVDRARAEEGADLLAGKHDFHNLTPDETGTVRDLSITVDRDGPFLELTFRAGGFARQLVRRLVTLLASFARGNSDRDRIERVLGPGSLPGPEGVAPAPPEPLVLTDVVYPDLSFRIDGDAIESARDVFGQRHEQLRSRARVARSIRDGIAETEYRPDQ
ncbi:tRNA pseudouridine(38-40) synthase TruA [Halapricum hydrolyticum]|uniref:tRNA pseudouridine synthase A n=1 Tax=Halapricum hydrolyticum TaxID=2979991 RepID=A0AAE3IDH4_9EURY|nr:tRNA pseudouridine(38-40) synthase TruA [Halapricum hydrolyticum]MCU4719047.1 tRNA pseudouridine(38-40) synthase TruA [Halapricum hydrolyticum]MCU4728036.1 tRNA pseudouridine(38-40) synthase TruA [Halapricum hydrolyticum]